MQVRHGDGAKRRDAGITIPMQHAWSRTARGNLHTATAIKKDVMIIKIKPTVPEHATGNPMAIAQDQHAGITRSSRVARTM